MYLNRLTEILGYLFGLRPKPAPCPVPRSTASRCLFIAAAILCSTRAAEASVLIAGDVTPSDNPFTLSVVEALPSAGNKVDPFADPNPAIAPTVQTLWEGINDAANNTNINTDVLVGRTGSGILQISQVELRDMNLVIGDSGTVSGGVTRFGDGTVYITGMGSLFNNDPYLLPPGLPSNFRSKNRRLDEPGGQYVNSAASPLPSGIPIPVASDGLDGAADGFDLYVGRTGVGTLRIDAFGRAEIEDAVLVGDATGSTGNLVIDGFNSFLGNGGSHDFGQASQTKPHMTIIGQLGTGNLTISNGATMATQVFASSGGGGNQGPVGASLGSSPYTLLTSGGGGTLTSGGSGTATITGLGSKWTIAGSMQVGGFDNGANSGGVLTTGGDLEGDDTAYFSQMGRGTLYVNDGGLVQIHNAIGVPPDNTTTSLVLAIGRFGVVQLAGGTIEVGSPIGGQQNQGTSDAVQVINDGLITGTGRINTGVFRNRYFGQVRVDPGQSLVIDSSSQFLAAAGATPNEPLTNFGLIQVLGNAQAQAQLEFVRAPATAGNPIRPFLNLPLGTATTPPPAPPAFTGGQISAQFANLRFGSGLQNQSLLAFTAGTNNVTGRVVSVGLDTADTESAGEAPGGDGGEVAQVLVSGPGTTAVFADDLAFGAGADLNLVNGGNVVVLNQRSFTMGGNLSMELSYTHPSLITVSGNVGIGPGSGGNNDLSLSLGSDVLHSLKHGDAFQLISFNGDIGNVDATNIVNPIPDLTVAPLFTDVDTSPSLAQIMAIYHLSLQIQFANNGVYAVFLNPAMVGPGSGAVAPDFNGDGVVDLADFAIWQAHVGQMSGASVLDGDADGDGDVDGNDFLKWQRNAGRPMPWTGSGAGSGSSVASVPEPASLILLAWCSLALAFGRQRSNR